MVQRLNAIMEVVAIQNNFAHAESLHPRSDGHCLVQYPANYCRDRDVERFHKASAEFVFPLQIGIPGRVWKSKRFAWHGDVATLPSTIYLRTELAKQSNLHGCVAVPVQVEAGSFFVVLFYCSYELGSSHIVEKLLQSIQSSLGGEGILPRMLIPEATPSEVDVVIGSRSVLSKSRSWLKCELALQKPAEIRGNDDVEDIMKFTRRLEFFKHMAEAQRYQLCHRMTLQRINGGELLHRSTDLPDQSLWRIVVLGRVAVYVTEPYGNPSYPVWHFDSGQTFAQSYLNLFLNNYGITAHIQSVTQCQCLQVRIPPEMQEEFKAWTRPLWYEELTRYFGVSINEAGEALGMCTSAIKKICRRHGIARWPHRKIASVDKTISSLQQRIKEMELSQSHDGDAIANLRSELMDAVRQRMQCGSNRPTLPVTTGDEEEEEDDDDSEKSSKGRRRAKKENIRDSPTADSPSDSNSRESPIDETSRKRGLMEYQGTHPVEFGIMQHQLNPIQSVHIFDEDQELHGDESPSDQDLYSTPINIRASSFDSSQGIDSIFLDSLDQPSSNMHNQLQGGGSMRSSTSLGQASAETMASVFGAAGIPVASGGGSGGGGMGSIGMQRQNDMGGYGYGVNRPAVYQQQEAQYSAVSGSMQNPSGFVGQNMRYPNSYQGGSEQPLKTMRSGAQGGMWMNTVDSLHPIPENRQAYHNQMPQHPGLVQHDTQGRGGGMVNHQLYQQQQQPQQPQQQPAVQQSLARHDMSRPVLIVRGATVPEEVQEAMRKWNVQRVSQGLQPVTFEFA